MRTRGALRPQDPARWPDLGTAATHPVARCPAPVARPPRAKHVGNANHSAPKSGMFSDAIVISVAIRSDSAHICEPLRDRTQNEVLNLGPVVNDLVVTHSDHVIVIEQ